MSESFQYPLEQMRQQAQTMQNETTNLADETHARIQAIQQLHASMPASMQGAFGDFISLMQKHLSSGLILRGHLSQSLTEAAGVMQEADATNAQGFK